ncbi:MAG TPA: hypothetical protein VFQ35_18755 [Polyangiaceae bacterium]|nr:hypothetical protein [Polyangiaceae bacterium]
MTLPSEPFALPATCACCGDSAFSQLGLRSGARRLLIPYCEPCVVHVANDATQTLAERLASLIAGLAACLALPIFLPWWSKVACSAACLVVAALPFARRLLRSKPRPPHTSHGRAAWFSSAALLVCKNERFAQELAARAGTQTEPRAGEKSYRVALAYLGVLAFVLAPLSHAYQHPSVRILNLGDLPFELRVDARALTRVEPSSGESPFAGADVNVPAGRRTFEARDAEGRVVDRTEVEVLAGSHHLYAPASPETCFWLETLGYGRGARKPAYEPLLGTERFWAIPDDVRGWFSPATDANPDARVTGGSARVLRQGPCADVPFGH